MSCNPATSHPCSALDTVGYGSGGLREDHSGRPSGPRPSGRGAARVHARDPAASTGHVEESTAYFANHRDLRKPPVLGATHMNCWPLVGMGAAVFLADRGSQETQMHQPSPRSGAARRVFGRRGTGVHGARKDLPESSNGSARRRRLLDQAHAVAFLRCLRGNRHGKDQKGVNQLIAASKGRLPLLWRGQRNDVWTAEKTLIRKACQSREMSEWKSPHRSLTVAALN